MLLSMFKSPFHKSLDFDLGLMIAVLVPVLLHSLIKGQNELYSCCVASLRYN